MHRKSCSEWTSQKLRRAAKLVRYLHHHLHARMDRAEHLHVTGLLEGDVGRRTRRLRAEIELVALAGRKDVVRDSVVVDEGQRIALLDGDVFGREHPALLVDLLVGGS